MLPQIIGPGVLPPASLASAVPSRAEQGAQPAIGETAAASLRPETLERVDPPRTLPATARLPEERRREALYPPDPDPLTGPPPAFDATPLDRARDAALAAVNLIAASDDPSQGGSTAPDADPAPVPALDLLSKAEADVAEVRRMSEPEPERTLDVTR
jgi:hypothetical protein